MTTEAMRAQFEAWSKGPLSLYDLARNRYGCYVCDATAFAWYGYQAALSSPAVVALVDALQIAVRQNSHDMQMTGEELRVCAAALAPFTTGAGHE